VKRRTQFRLLVALTIVWAVWAGWSLLGQATPYALRALDDLGSPVPGAVIDIGGEQVGTTADNGRVELEWTRSSTVLEVSAPGHIPRTVTVSEPPEGAVDVVLRARVLRGRVVDADGSGVEGALVEAGPASAVTDGEGEFQIRGAEQGQVIIERPAWTPTSFEWQGGQGEVTVELTPFTARAVHITGEAARDRLDEFMEMAQETELNALMVDLKDETGLVWYDTDDPTAHEVGAANGAYDLSGVVDRAHAEGLYVIGRLVLFNDPIASVRAPEMAVWNSATNSVFNANGQYFLDPTDADARGYGLALAREACSMGVDEIQFDYVRFPDVRPESIVFDGGVSPDTRMSTINSFLHDAVAALHPMGCAVGADVFGFITTALGDGQIGQRWEDIAQIVDVVSPMVYPSHYGPDWFGYENPNDHPGPVVEQALADGMERLPRQVVVRPWLQDFGYDEGQVRDQIEVAENFGLGWMLWNAASDVTTSALRRPR
jgi:hypothetical protein